VTSLQPRLGPGVLDELGRRLAPADAELAAATGTDQALVDAVLPGVLAKLEREPVEDLRIDFEDGYGPRPDEAEDADAADAARTLAAALAGAAPPPCSGLRVRSLESSRATWRCWPAWRRPAAPAAGPTSSTCPRPAPWTCWPPPGATASRSAPRPAPTT
jgi:hypothetical protein